MTNLFKKTILSAVGAAVVTRERAEEAFGEFVRQGKVSAGDARIMAEKITVQGRKEFETASHTLGDKIKETLARIDEPTKTRIAALEARIKALEKKHVSRPVRARKT